MSDDLVSRRLTALTVAVALLLIAGISAFLYLTHSSKELPIGSLRGEQSRPNNNHGFGEPDDTELPPIIVSNGGSIVVEAEPMSAGLGRGTWSTSDNKNFSHSSPDGKKPNGFEVFATGIVVSTDCLSTTLHMRDAASVSLNFSDGTNSGTIGFSDPSGSKDVQVTVVTAGTWPVNTPVISRAITYALDLQNPLTGANDPKLMLQTLTLARAIHPKQIVTCSFNTSGEATIPSVTVVPWR